MTASLIPRRPFSPLEVMSYSSSETRSLGEKIGRKLGTKLIIGLSGELGSGKTSFVQGLAKGLEVPENYTLQAPLTLLFMNIPVVFHFFISICTG